MNAIIVSDLHIGSKYFLHQEFLKFFKSIPETFDIILNGDIIDNPYKKLNLPNQHIMDLIEQISYRQRVVWVLGNHDNGDIPDEFGNVRITRTHALGHKLLVTHGHDFDEIMPRNYGFMKMFKMLHKLRVMLGARPVHVAQYAKKWPMLYKVLRENVLKNAVNCALENGFEAVTCGHTHFPEDTTFKDVRYINTGAWTESPTYYLLLTDAKMTLNKMDSLQNAEQSIQEIENVDGVINEIPVDRLT